MNSFIYDQRIEMMFLFKHLWLPNAYRKVHRWVRIFCYLAHAQMKNSVLKKDNKKKRILPGLDAAYWGVGKD